MPIKVEYFVETADERARKGIVRKLESKTVDVGDDGNGDGLRIFGDLGDERLEPAVVAFNVGIKED